MHLIFSWLCTIVAMGGSFICNALNINGKGKEAKKLSRNLVFRFALSPLSLLSLSPTIQGV
jgi:hypothetical protein